MSHNEHFRLRERIARELVNAGILDNRRKTSFEYSFSGKLPRLTQRWRSGMEYKYGIKYLISLGVPLWFMKRHIKEIVKLCTWSRSHAYGGGRSHEWTTLNEEDGMRASKLDYFTLDGDVIVYAMSKDAKTKLEKGTLFVRDIDTTQRFEVVIPEVLSFWQRVRNRHISIYGRHCKACNTHTKEAGIICDDFDKYVVDICPKCLKSFCKLTEDAKLVMVNRKVA